MSENTKKREATKQKLRDALMELYGQYEFQKISVSMLCAEAGLHRSTFYLYYNNTNELLREIENRILKEIQKYVNVVNDFDFRGDSRSFQEIFDQTAPRMLKFYNWQFSMRNYINPLLGDYGDPYFKQRYEQIIHDNIISSARTFKLKYADRPYIVKYIVGGVLRTNMEWLRNNDISAEELMDIQRRMVFNNPFA